MATRPQYVRNFTHIREVILNCFGQVPMAHSVWFRLGPESMQRFLFQLPTNEHKRLGFWSIYALASNERKLSASGGVKKEQEAAAEKIQSGCHTHIHTH